MDWNSYLQAEGGEIVYPDSDVPISAYSNPPPNLPSDVVEPSIAKYIGFMALIYFIGTRGSTWSVTLSPLHPVQPSLQKPPILRVMPFSRFKKLF